MTRTQWRIRKLSRRMHRVYKGASDIIAILLALAGIAATGWGVLLYLVCEWSSVLWIAIGFGLVYLASEAYDYGRR